MKKHYKLISDEKIYEVIKNKERFKVRNSLRFREEKDFTLVNIRWGNTISVDNELAAFLDKYMKSQESFTIDQFGEENTEWLANLYFKDVFIAESYKCDDNRSFMGVSANIDHIPFVKKIEKTKLKFS